MQVINDDDDASKGARGCSPVVDQHEDDGGTAKQEQPTVLVAGLELGDLVGFKGPLCPFIVD